MQVHLSLIAYIHKQITTLFKEVLTFDVLDFLQHITSCSGTVRTRVFTHVLPSDYYHICFLSCTCYVRTRIFTKIINQ